MDDLKVNGIGKANMLHATPHIEDAKSKKREADFTDTRVWLGLLRILRLLGQLPVQIDEGEQPSSANACPIKNMPSVTGELFRPSKIRPEIFMSRSPTPTPTPHLKVQFLCPIMAYTVLVGFFFRLAIWWATESDLFPSLACLSTAGRNVQQEGDVSGRNATRAEVLIGQLAGYMLPVINMLEWFFTMSTVPFFIQFLNNWKQFNDSPLRFLSPARKESRICVWSVRTTYVALLGPYILFLIIMTSISHGLGLVHCVTFGGFLLSLVKGTFFAFVAQFEDIKVLFMFFAVITGFFKIRRELQAFKARLLMNEICPYSPLTSEEVQSTLRKSLEAVQAVRRQAALTCTVQGPHELLFFTYMIFIVTFTLFLTFAPLLRRATIAPMFAFEKITRLALGMARICLKCRFAEQITDEEKRVAEEILSWNLTRHDLGARIEAKNVVDLITGSPTKITYGSLITIDKRFMLSIGTQIITYMIILLQFQQIG